MNIDKQIEAQKRKLETIDHRIGCLMTQRADGEDKLAGLIEHSQCSVAAY